MKLVINTQYRENYGAHDWDGEGECPQYWKSKGGSEYVIENISYFDVLHGGDLVDSVRDLIEYSNEASLEYIIDWEVVGDAEVTWEHWQAPWFLKKEDGKWVATRRPTHWTIPVEETFTMLPQGGRENYGYVGLQDAG